jgi:hypothetical protein
MTLSATLFGQSKESPRLVDTFTINAFSNTWKTEDRVKALEITGDRSFVLTADSGTDLHYPASGAFKRHNAPKTLFRPSADFEFSAKLTPTFQTKYNGGALLLYSDTTQWAKMLFQYTGEKCIVGMSVVESSLTDDSYYAVSDSVSIYMKLKKAGAVCSFYLSSDGVYWNLTRQFVYANPASMRVGFYAQSPLGPECTVVFSGIVYKAL